MFKRFCYNVPKITKRCSRSFSIPCKKNDPWQPETKVSILDNGIRVATEESNSPFACISLYAEAGPRFETANNNGITHFIEHLAFKGFNGMDRRCVEETALYSSVHLTARTTQELQCFTATCPVEFAPKVISILCNIITNLSLSECDIATERYNICLELLDADNDPKTLVFENLHMTAFQGTSLGQRVIGPSRNIERFDSKSVAAFLSEHYQPWRLVVAASGYICHENVVSCVSSELSKLQHTLDCEPEWGARRFSGSEMTYRNDSMPYAHVAIAVEAPGYTDPDYYYMMLLKHIMGQYHRSLGGGEHISPQLAQHSSLSSLCESYEPFYITYRDVGLWGMYFVSQPLEIEAMVYNFQHHLMRLCLMIGLTDLERAICLLHMELSRMCDGSVNSCHDIGIQMMYRCQRKTLEEHFWTLENVIMLNLKAAAMKYLYDRCPVVAAVGPTEGLPEYNRIRAGMYWLRF